MVGTEEPAAEAADFHLRLQCDPASVPRARAQVRDWCHEAGIRGDALSNIQLAVTEAATNAVQHSTCVDFDIHGWISDAAVTVSVWDRGRGLSDPQSGAGLGTRIIRQLAASVDFEHTEPGTRVTMRFHRQASV